MKAKISLNRDDVVASALRIVDAQGLDGLTVRKVADEFGVTPMALYWHFSNKEALLAAVGDAVLAGLRQPSEALELEQYLREGMAALVDAVRPHPHVTPLVMQRLLASDSGRELTESALDKLITAGFGVDKAAAIAHYALTNAMTLVAGEPGAETTVRPAERTEALETKLAFLQSLPVDRFPRLRAAAPHMVQCGDSDHYYSDAIDIFVAGVMADVRTLTA